MTPHQFLALGHVDPTPELLTDDAHTIRAGIEAHERCAERRCPQPCPVLAVPIPHNDPQCPERLVLRYRDCPQKRAELAERVDTREADDVVKHLERHWGTRLRVEERKHYVTEFTRIPRDILAAVGVQLERAFRRWPTLDEVAKVVQVQRGFAAQKAKADGFTVRAVAQVAATPRARGWATLMAAILERRIAREDAQAFIGTYASNPLATAAEVAALLAKQPKPKAPERTDSTLPQAGLA